MVEQQNHNLWVTSSILVSGTNLCPGSSMDRAQGYGPWNEGSNPS
jgi:hypothetical protein